MASARLRRSRARSPPAVGRIRGGPAGRPRLRDSVGAMPALPRLRVPPAARISSLAMAAASRPIASNGTPPDAGQVAISERRAVRAPPLIAHVTVRLSIIACRSRHRQSRRTMVHAIVSGCSSLLARSEPPAQQTPRPVDLSDVAEPRDEHEVDLDPHGCVVPLRGRSVTDVPRRGHRRFRLRKLPAGAGVTVSAAACRLRGEPCPHRSRRSVPARASLRRRACCRNGPDSR